MGIRYRNATPGTILLLAATALLAVVSFNTPLLKSLYFLHAKFDAGEYAGDLYLGTLGYCLKNGGQETCVGPKIGYEFDPNKLFGISVFDIPTTVTKYLTYTFILHIIALAAAAGSFIFGLLSHIGTMGVWCFPTCLASIASSIALLALIFDLVIFYISRARINAVQGASADIGISVWLVLAAWLVAGIGGCAFGIGNCCFGSRGRGNSGDSKMEYYANQMRTDDMRMQALRDEQLRKKEQGLPSFQELERTPLTGAGAGTGEREDIQYMYEEQPLPNSRSNGNLARDGSVLQGVGMGYGRKNPSGGFQQGTFGNAYGQGYDTLQPPQNLARRDSIASGVTAGNAGVGAGGQGVEGPEEEQQQQQGGYGGYYGNQNNNYYGDYNDPYAQRPYEYGNDSYASNGSQGHGQGYDQNGQPYGQYDQRGGPSQSQSPVGYEGGGGGTGGGHQYPPIPNSSSMTMPTPNPNPSGGLTAMPQPRTSGGGGPRYDPYSNPGSSDSHYQDPGPRVSQAADPYGGYDEGLGAIGLAATSPNMDSPHQSPAQGQGYNSNPNSNSYYDSYSKDRGFNQNQNQNQYGNDIHVPQPQHLVTSGSATDLLHSPRAEGSGGGLGGVGGGGGYRMDSTSPHDYHTAEGVHGDEDEDDVRNRPPSYGQIAGIANGQVNPGGGGGGGGVSGGWRNEKSGYR